MANINTPILFMTTSPRTPAKMVPEIELLIRKFNGQEWNRENQVRFMEALREEDFFNGKGSNDPAFSARDRINRAPQSLGFVILKPHIVLTPAGKTLLTTHNKGEVFLRQMLKFQILSPYHRLGNYSADFWVKPYLEILRLIRHFQTLRFDELQIFGMQITNWHRFDDIVSKIEHFRESKEKYNGNYQVFKREVIRKELESAYSERILRKELKTRESNEVSLKKFFATQINNMRDYADACVRYLRATGLISVSHVGKTLSIVEERKTDVDFILNYVGRDPVFVEDRDKYLDYLGNDSIPTLLTDNKQLLTERIHTEFPQVRLNASWDITKLKEVLYELTEERKSHTLNITISAIKDYKQYDDIQDVFNRIRRNDLYDLPLMLEWNTWRAMTMLDGGEIKANLNFDDYGQPLSTAQGNKSDIICDYKDFFVSVEVTMSAGQRQYEMEAEPVSRHLGILKKETKKTCYCLFIAPTINEASVAHFLGLHHLNISYYGGKSVIVPLPLDVFQQMIARSYDADYVPNPSQVKHFFEYSESVAGSGCNEKQWYDAVLKKAINWLE